MPKRTEVPLGNTSQRHRNWTITQHDIMNMPMFDDTVHIFLIYQLEIGEETKKEHWQGFVQWKNPVTLERVCKWQKGCHAEPMRGTIDDNIKYCSKSKTKIGDTVMFGSPKNEQGKRNDLIEVKELLDNGGSMLDVADNHFEAFIRYNRGFEKYLLMKRGKEIRPNKKVILIVGQPGSGKTTYCYNNYPDLYKTNDITWFDGYAGEPAILIDDIVEFEDANFWLNFLDIWPNRLELKGSFMPSCAEVILITSNFGIDELLKKSSLPDVTKRAIKRRITQVIEMN